MTCQKISCLNKHYTRKYNYRSFTFKLLVCDVSHAYDKDINNKIHKNQYMTLLEGLSNKKQ